jgi:hypothetical protein
MVDRTLLVLRIQRAQFEGQQPRSRASRKGRKLKLAPALFLNRNRRSGRRGSQRLVVFGTGGTGAGAVHGRSL